MTPETHALYRAELNECATLDDCLATIAELVEHRYLCAFAGVRLLTEQALQRAEKAQEERLSKLLKGEPNATSL